MIPVTSHLIVLSQTVSLPVAPTADSQNTPEGVWTRSMAGGGSSKSLHWSPLLISQHSLSRTHTLLNTHTHTMLTVSSGVECRAHTHIHTHVRTQAIWCWMFALLGSSYKGEGRGPRLLRIILTKFLTTMKQNKKKTRRKCTEHMETQTVSQVVLFCRGNLYQIWNFFLETVSGCSQNGRKD